MTPEKAIKFLDEEIVRLEGAPIINGCEMTDDWRGHLEICKLAKSALEKQIPKSRFSKKQNVLTVLPLILCLFALFAIERFVVNLMTILWHLF